MVNLKVSTFYDLDCNYCNTSYSVEESLPIQESNKQSLLTDAINKGWKNSKQYGNLCPHCAKELNVK